MERLQQILKDPQKLSQLAKIGFAFGIVFSTYFLFTFPNDLEWFYKEGKINASLTSWVSAKVFLVIAITFALGFVAIHAAMKVKKEIIVFKEKTESAASQASNMEAQAAAIDIQTFTSTIKGAKADKVLQLGLSSICHSLQAGQGAFYSIKETNGKRMAEMKSAFAIPAAESEKVEFEFGEGLVGQVAASGKSMYLDELPEGYSNAIVSGLGTAAPKYLFVAAVKKENTVKAVIEVATFSPLSEASRKQAEEMAGLLAERI
jgi:hypothetical protein